MYYIVFGGQASTLTAEISNFLAFLLITYLPPLPNRLRANPIHRGGCDKDVRLYLYFLSPIPPSS